MRIQRSLILIGLVAVTAALLLTAGSSAPSSKTNQVARGKYLVGFGGCSDCHTPLKFTDKGPVPDFSRLLSGHPETTKLPPPPLQPGPWFAATAGMTAWAGPWGITYAANLTPDTNTGLGIWSEQMFVTALRTGKHMGAGRGILPPMPWQSLAQLTDDDLKAIFAYLLTLPPVMNHVPEPIAPNLAKFE
jgi:mono/diheme cytochrome c family protein